MKYLLGCVCYLIFVYCFVYERDLRDILFFGVSSLFFLLSSLEFKK